MTDIIDEEMEPTGRIMRILGIAALVVVLIVNVQAAVRSPESAVVAAAMVVVTFRIGWLSHRQGSPAVYDMALMAVVSVIVHSLMAAGTQAL